MSDDFDPWGTPKEKKKKATPPSGGGGGNNNGRGGKKPEPDFEQAFRKLGEQFKSFGGGGDDNKKFIKYAAIGVVGLWLLTTSVFMLSSGEKAVILRFGEYHRTLGEGLNFKLPYPAEKSFVKSTTKVNQFDIGANQENLMVTADENIADVKYTVLWRIKDLKSFVFNVTEQEFTVRAAAESAMREVIGNTKLAVALGEGEGRGLITLESQQILQSMLDSYKAGVEIVGVQLKRVDVPPQVIEAQIDVQNAKTEQEKMKNQAEAYSNDILPRARGDAEKLVKEAEGYKQAKISQSTGDASRFVQIYDEYKNARDVTKKRMYLETMQEIMTGMDKVIMDDKSGTVPYMPLSGFKAAKPKAEGAL